MLQEIKAVTKKQPSFWYTQVSALKYVETKTQSHDIDFQCAIS